MIGAMLRSGRPLILVFVILVAFLLVTSLVYRLGMTHLEGEQRSFWQALEWASETLSSTGYGKDNAWRHPLMTLFVVTVQFAGVFVVFLILPAYLIPVLESRFEARLPTEARDLEGHFVIFGFGPAVATLLNELERADQRFLVVESDETRARAQHDRGRRVVFGSVDEGVLEEISLGEASVVVANSTDDENAAILLSARQAGFEGDLVAIVEDPFHRRPMMLAGATATYTPRHILGAALAARASRLVSPTISGIQQLGRHLHVREIRIGADTPLAGSTLEQAELGRRTGVQAVGQWVKGGLEVFSSALDVLEPEGILIVVGTEENVKRAAALCEGAALRRQGPFVVGGYGEVGKKLVQLLRDAGEEVLVIDIEDRDGVDLRGSVLSEEILRASGARDAQAVILALDRDSAILFATVILKDLFPEVPVIARVNRQVNVERMHRAGAEFALSMSQVSGQILARRLLGEQVVSLDDQLEILAIDRHRLAGRNPSEEHLRDQTGSSLIAVERGDMILVDFGGDFRFEKDDIVYVCGSPEATRRFVDLYGVPA